MPSKQIFRVPKTHGDALKSVCACCWRKKGPMRDVLDKVSDQLKRFIYSEYNKESDIHPVVICDSCRVTLSYLDKVKYRKFLHTNICYEF